MSICEYMGTVCTAPDTVCPHWIGTYCELDIWRIETYEHCDARQ